MDGKVISELEKLTRQIKLLNSSIEITPNELEQDMHLNEIVEKNLTYIKEAEILHSNKSHTSGSNVTRDRKKNDMSKNSIMKERQENGNLIVKQTKEMNNKEKEPHKKSVRDTITCTWQKIERKKKKNERKVAAQIKANQVKRIDYAWKQKFTSKQMGKIRQGIV